MKIKNIQLKFSEIFCHCIFDCLQVMDELQRILQPSNHKYIGELKERWKVFCSKLQFYGVMKKVMRPPMTLDEGKFNEINFAKVFVQFAPIDA